MENNAVSQKNLPSFGIKDKIGYAAGDLANNLTFTMASSFLMVFYTEVLAIPPEMVGTLFVVSRVIDAFTDVGMGVIVDRMPATKNGKFRPWIRRVAGPIAIASFLMYQSGMADASFTAKVIYMYVTYILWGSISYTAVNIPYGSMASAITPNPGERTELSAFRTIGQVSGQLIIGVFVPLLIFSRDANGNQVVQDGSRFTLIAGILAVLTVGFYMLCYSLTTERVKFDEPSKEEKEEKEKVSLFQTLKSIITSRSLIAITGSSIFLLMTMILMTSMYNYLFPNYFNSSSAISTINFINPIATIFLVVPLASNLGRKIGKKEAATLGMAVGSILNLLLFFIKTDSVVVFIAISSLAYMALNVFNVLVWATITDVIDDLEVRNHKRDDGTVYAVNSFARKVGQALAGGLSGWALGFIGYEAGANQQTPEVLDGIYNISTMAPALGFFTCALILFFVYPLSKQRTLENQQILEDRRA